MNGMSSTNKGIARFVAVSAVAALTLGVTACTGEATADTSSKSALAVALGEDPGQDAVDLYTDRDTAVDAAIKALPAFIKKALKQTGVPGASVAVVSNGKVVFEEGYGVRDMTTGGP